MSSDCDIYLLGSLETESIRLLWSALDALGLKERSVLTSFTSNPSYHAEEVKKEIAQRQPRLILCLGSSALLTLFPTVDDSLSASRAFDGEWGGALVRATYSPKYLFKRGGARTREYRDFIQDIKNAWLHVTGEGVQDLEVRLYGPDQCLEFVQEFIHEPRVALDYEGSSLNPLEEKYSLAGVGLATDTKAGYLWLEDYATVGTPVDPAVITKLGRLLQFLDSRELMVFNANYETLVTLNVFGYRLRGERTVVDVAGLKAYLFQLSEQERERYPQLLEFVSKSG